MFSKGEAMKIGEKKLIKKGYYTHGKLTTKEMESHVYKILKIYPDDINEKKDLILCEDVKTGVRECFHRMELEACDDKLS